MTSDLEGMMTVIRADQAMADAVDCDWYFDRFVKSDSNVQRAGFNADAHYIDHGRAAGFDPHPLFSTRYYLSLNDDVSASNKDPYRHYIEFGREEGRRCHPLLKAGTPLYRDVSSAGQLTKYANSLFDVEAYHIFYSKDGIINSDPLLDYLVYGRFNGRTPNPLFSPIHYHKQARDRIAATDDAFVHFLVEGWRENLDPHPLFDVCYARERGGYRSDHKSPFEVFITAPWRGKGPHPLFDIHIYQLQDSVTDWRRVNPLRHYLLSPDRFAKTHALFDGEYYLEQIDCEEVTNTCLEHYIEIGISKDLSPHPLFDPLYFKSTSPSEISQLGLIGYLSGAQNNAGNYFILVRPQDENNEASVLERYLIGNNNESWLFHPLFRVRDYLRSASAFCANAWKKYSSAQLVDKRTLFSESNILRDPLGHYLRYGWQENLSPCAAFDPDFYRSQIGSLNSEPVAHYLRHGHKDFSPSPAFCLETYRANVFDESADLVHFLESEDGKRAPCNSVLDKDFYLCNNEDIRKWNVEPWKHFVLYGAEENRPPNEFFSEEYVLRNTNAQVIRSSVVLEYMRRLAKRPAIVFVGHEASRTGAPIILLKIIENFLRFTECDLYVLLGRGGDLLSEYMRIGQVSVMKNGLDETYRQSCKDHDGAWLGEFERKLKAIGTRRIKAAICNTSEVRAFAHAFQMRRIPVMTLVHEAADPYSAREFNAVFANSDAIVFPSQYTERRALAKVGHLPKNSIIRGQGLLKPYLIDGNRLVHRAKLRADLNLPDDATIILGCGTVDRRKGADLFVEVATRLRSSEHQTIHFIWLGSSRSGDDLIFFAKHELETHGLGQSFSFIENQQDPSVYFLGSDLFLLTSRIDPFPCVVHEAMASALPVICFSGWSGAAEALEEAGVVVATGDVAAMAAATERLIEDQHERDRLGHRGQELIRLHWSNDRYVAELRAFLKEKTGVEVPLLDEVRGDNGAQVLFLQPDWGISGVNTFTEHLIEGLRTEGFDARLLFTNGRFTTLSEAHMPRVPYQFMETNNSAPHQIWTELLRRASDARPCILVPNYDYIASAVCPLLPEGVGVLGIAHSDDVEHYEHVYRLGRHWEHIVAVSRRIADEIGALNPSFVPKLSTVYYGVPFDKSKTEMAMVARQSRTGSRQPIRIAYSGRITEHQKRVRSFADLAEALTKAEVPFQLTLVGEGDELEELGRRLAHFIAAGIVSLPGRMDSAGISKVLAESDVFCLMSDFEGLPLSLLEAMALGVIPVVRDMKSGIREVIEDGVSGFVCERRGMASFVEVLDRLQKQSAVRERVSAATVNAFVTQGLDTETMVKKYVVLFRKIFDDMRTTSIGKALPLAYNAPIKGIAAPPFMTGK